MLEEAVVEFVTPIKARVDELLNRRVHVWKALLDREGLTRSYWQQKEGGGWEKRG